MSEKAKTLFLRRRQRVRQNLRRAANNRPRLSVFRSSKHIYAQVIDDAAGRTLAAASTLDRELKSALETGADIAAASAVGKLVAERAKAAGVERVVFDRGANLNVPGFGARRHAMPYRIFDQRLQDEIWYTRIERGWRDVDGNAQPVLETCLFDLEIAAQEVELLFQ